MGVPFRDSTFHTALGAFQDVAVIDDWSCGAARFAARQVPRSSALESAAFLQATKSGFRRLAAGPLSCIREEMFQWKTIVTVRTLPPMDRGRAR
ncbi:hypothetical protein HPB47_024298 [Ixodes persulcatus]|uniref:Uncharacterized protein n=1 Tax=Ixodes persulcatus TaxID=34615 RepID=A0AC60Q4P8_IXOPE|nr:hypothetical protein HPB47_024298 [Ixodes persulcatus]